MSKHLFTGLAIAGTMAFAAPLLVSAQAGTETRPETARAEAAQRADGTQARERMHRHEGHRHEGFHRAHGRQHAHEARYAGGPMGGHGFEARMLRGLDLSESQRDRIFELRHAQAPAMREQGKILRNAQRELRALAMSADYDDAKAGELSERAAKAMAEMARLRARNGNEVWKLLSPEQREKVGERMARWQERGGPGRGARS
jgi:Spy/CpxP family protein refolding chaperone